MMAQAISAAVREPETKTPQQYARRVHQLAAAYAVLFVASLVGVGVLIWQAQLLVTLTQRSNVETLVLAFFLLFFGYLAVLSAPGIKGAAQVAYYALLARTGQDRQAVERRKAASVKAQHKQPSPPVVGALNLVVEQEGQPGQVVTLRVVDDAGEVGRLEIDGAELRHHDALSNGSNSLLAYTVEQINEVLGERTGPTRLDIVGWKQIDDELTESYLSQVRFARNLERQLGADELWPKLRLTADDREELERRLTAICPALRDEAFLPDWEYQAEHKVPLIPEPLGLVSLSRSERRTDPVTSMGCGVLVVLAALLALGLLIAFPPWVPGS